jgi:mono/diheme cytochrome c family protein
MKRFLVWVLVPVAIGFGAQLKAADSAFDAERAKAQANPYANDFGPEKLTDAQLSGYPADLQAAYKDVLLVKCAKCHSPARPLNSQFFEVPGKGPEKQANLDNLKKTDPDMFSLKNVWQAETDIWQRYVKRMMSKPGCEITEPEGKAVYRFLAYDSQQRKAGKSKAAWKSHREKLLADFKAKNPSRYKELYEK